MTARQMAFASGVLFVPMFLLCVVTLAAAVVVPVQRLGESDAFLAGALTGAGLVVFGVTLAGSFVVLWSGR